MESCENSKIFTATDAINHKTCTILVETIKPRDGETFVSITTLEGEYDTREEFEDALDFQIKGWKTGYAHKDEMKKWKLICLKIPGAQKLAHVLNEVCAVRQGDENK